MKHCLHVYFTHSGEMQEKVHYIVHSRGGGVEGGGGRYSGRGIFTPTRECCNRRSHTGNSDLKFNIDCVTLYIVGVGRQDTPTRVSSSPRLNGVTSGQRMETEV